MNEVFSERDSCLWSEGEPAKQVLLKLPEPEASGSASRLGPAFQHPLTHPSNEKPW